MGRGRLAMELVVGLSYLIQVAPISRESVPHLRAIDIDMGRMTDAFMSAAIVMALAHGTSRIRNVANQRVKECNRIAAVVDALSSLGVRATETVDGLIIEGAPHLFWHVAVESQETELGNLPPSHISIDPHNDHRLAMAFAILGVVFPGGLTILNKQCVQKTFPSFWDTLETIAPGCCIGCNFSECRAPESILDRKSRVGSFQNNRSLVVILVGMRRSGKSCLGRKLADLMGLRFIDTDTLIGEQYAREMLSQSQEVTTERIMWAQGLHCLIKDRGWDEFRAREYDILTHTLHAISLSAEGAVLCCGGGIVEHTSALDLLSALALKSSSLSWQKSLQERVTIVEIRRPLEQMLKIEENLACQHAVHDSDTLAASYISPKEPFLQQWNKREPLYRTASSVSFLNDSDVFDPETSALLLLDLISSDGGPLSCTGDSGSWTNFGCLTFSSSSHVVSWCEQVKRSLEKALQKGEAVSKEDALEQICEDAERFDPLCGLEAIEVRLDKVSDLDINEILRYVQYIRALSFCTLSSFDDGVQGCLLPVRFHSLPLIMTLRSINEGGEYAGMIHEYIKTLQMFLRTGPRYLDVEATRLMGEHDAYQKLRQLLERFQDQGGKVIVSYHECYSETSRTSANLNDDNLKKVFCAVRSRCHPIKVERHVCMVSSEHDLTRLCRKVSQLYPRADVFKFVLSPDDMHSFVPSITEGVLRALSLGSRSILPNNVILLRAGHGTGVISRILASHMNPVTIRCLPSIAAPGQKTVKELNELRSAVHIFDRRKFYLFGSLVSASPSPKMHNCAFQRAGLPFSYEAIDVDPTRIDDALKLMKMPEFGGASVTVPLKQAFNAHLDGLTFVAKSIGAVNTVVRDHAGRLIGDNTDYLGICAAIQEAVIKSWKLSHNGLKEAIIIPKCRGLVVGAGGTGAAAVYALLQLHIVSVAVLNRSKKRALHLVERFASTRVTAAEGSRIDINDYDVLILSLPPAAALPIDFSHLHRRILVLDVAYTNSAERERAYKVARQKGAIFASPLSMLLSQAEAQFYTWTGLTPPRHAMASALNTSFPTAFRGFR